jgi:hypothetical protein
LSSNGSLTIVLHRGEQHKDQVRDDPHVKLALDMIEKVAVIIEGRDDSASFNHQWLSGAASNQFSL